ncbi:thioredoxin-like protein [Cutaneotrichosporon oleaginosum]|uniref:thioredoxin-dependent peroxiredoxin n=1 Tax=Cutaneotrichosporon oleaginosum TaxID=879819 RepID=A0A0J0XNK7_9TREE|nr:thioredoxin-like protein [Cutaneotrichosporon oleaginosum]KLT42662.1 thioredoxin-like protein [Cutaneotrichosporon oleaginosum]TXT05222.1 hypothetical protein COLE_06542 [Cutaneotrichosporon oleaginosum]
MPKAETTTVTRRSARIASAGSAPKKEEPKPAEKVTKPKAKPKSTEAKAKSTETQPKSTEAKSKSTEAEPKAAPKSKEPKSTDNETKAAPKSKEPKSKETKAKEPKSKETKTKEPKSKEPKSKETKAKEPKSKETKPKSKPKPKSTDDKMDVDEPAEDKADEDKSAEDKPKSSDNNKPPSASRGALQLGSTLPKLTLQNEDGEDVDVSTLTGERGVVIFLYPRADTPGCTNQACGYRDLSAELGELGYDVYGLSKDKPAAQLKWKTKKELKYHLLSDPESKLIKRLGAFIAPSNTKRSHFIFEKGSGKLIEAALGVKAAEDPKNALKFLQSHHK